MGEAVDAVNFLPGQPDKILILPSPSYWAPVWAPRSLSTPGADVWVTWVPAVPSPSL